MEKNGLNINLREVDAINDAKFVLSLRTDPELSKYMSPTENNLEKQKEWLLSRKTIPNELFFIVENKNNESVGTIRIYNVEDKCFCWGSWIIKEEDRTYASLESIFLLFCIAFEEKEYEYTIFDVKKVNTKALSFYLRLCAKIVNESENDYYLIFTKEQFFEQKDKLLDVIKKQYERRIKY